MSTFRTLAFAATLATVAVAYATPLEARNDLDFSPEDLDVLFGRDLDFSLEDADTLFSRDAEPEAEYEESDELFTREAEPEAEYDNFDELIARDAYAEAEADAEALAQRLYIRALLARDPSVLSALSPLAKLAKSSKVKETFKKATNFVHKHKDVAHKSHSVLNHGMNTAQQYQDIKAQSAQTQAQQIQNKQMASGQPMGRRDVFEEDPEMWY